MIYINAPIGAGKTSLAKILANDLGTTAFLEDPSKIPALNGFYQSGKASRALESFDTQIEFLAYRYDQLLKGIHLQEAGMRNTIYDSSLISDALMSHNLYRRGEFPERFYKDYLHISNLMQKNVAGHPFTGPDLIIYLDIPFKLMLQHIQQRGRKMETTDKQLIDYYQSVWDIYDAWYKSWGQSPTMRIDMAKYDFVNSDEDRKDVLNQIETEMYHQSILTHDQLQELQAKHAN